MEACSSRGTDPWRYYYPPLQMKKQKFREVKELDQGHTATNRGRIHPQSTGFRALALSYYFFYLG